MLEMKVTRRAPGYYTVRHGEYVVQIVRNEQLDYAYGQWIAYARWDWNIVSDPIIYLADAKRQAKRMIENKMKELGVEA